jgi:hypothetical protein
MKKINPGFHRTLFAAVTSTLALAAGGCAPIDSLQEQRVAEISDALATCEAARADERAVLQAQTAELTAFRAELAERYSLLASHLGLMEERLRQPEQTVVVPAPDCEVSPTEPPAKMTVGRRERVWLEDLQLALPARIDTGAETASLDARNIERFERDGDAWVRFDILRPRTDELLTMERPLEREARVIQSNTDDPEKRPVITLGIQIGSVRQMAEFTLSDRSHLDYQVLVGRNILQDVMIVDVSEVNLAPTPRMPEADAKQNP